MLLGGEDRSHVEIFQTIDCRGRDIRSTAEFCKGDFVRQYKGQLISCREGQQRLNLQGEDSQTKDAYIFFYWQDKNMAIDATKDDDPPSFGRLQSFIEQETSRKIGAKAS